MTGVSERAFVAVVALVALMPACRCGKSVTLRSVDEGVEASAPPIAIDLRALLCGERAPCRLLAKTPAGSKTVATIVRAGAADAGSGDDDPTECVDVERWLVSKGADGGWQREQLLVTDCVWRPEKQSWDVSVKNDVVRFEHNGQDVPSTWVGTEWAEISLAPPWPSLVGEGGSHWNRLQRCPNAEVATRASGFTRSVTWRGALRCDAPDGPCTPPHAFFAIPRASLAPAFEGGDWNGAVLGSCSLSIDGTTRGFVIEGTPGGPSDAELRVVISEGEVLYVEVRDDHFEKGDHVELWSVPQPASYMGCISKQAKPTVWSIALSDAGPPSLVARGADDEGVPDARSSPTLDRAASSGRVTLRLRLPGGAEGLDGLTVAYADTDDGRPKSVIATSKLARGRYETVGRVARLRDTRCTARGGTLDVVAPLQKATAIWSPLRSR